MAELGLTPGAKRPMVLVVEDEADSPAPLVELLHSLPGSPFEVVTAGSDVQVLDQLRDAPPDCVLIGGRSARRGSGSCSSSSANTEERRAPSCSWAPATHSMRSRRCEREQTITSRKVRRPRTSRARSAWRSRSKASDRDVERHSRVGRVHQKPEPRSADASMRPHAESRAPAWGCRSAKPMSRRWAARSSSTANPVKDPPSQSSCHSLRHPITGTGLRVLEKKRSDRGRFDRGDRGAYASCGSAPATTGNVTVIVVPSSGADSTRMVPPWRSTTALEIARPMPAPCAASSIDRSHR